MSWSICPSTFPAFSLISSTKHQTPNSYKFNVLEMTWNGSKSSFKSSKILSFNIFSKALIRFRIHNEMPLTMLKQYITNQINDPFLFFSLGLIVRLTPLPKPFKASISYCDVIKTKKQNLSLFSLRLFMRRFSNGTSAKRSNEGNK